MNLESVINKNYDRLTANDREVIAAVLKNRGETAKLNSTELSAYCHISRTTLVRLIKKLGLASFAEFRLLLKERAGGQEAEYPDMEEIIGDYHRMVNDLKGYDYRAVCRRIYEAETIYVFGTGNEQKAIAEEFKRIFLMFGKCCIDLFDCGEAAFAAPGFREKDLFLVISLSGESANGIEILRFVQQRKIHTVSLTRWNNNTMARMCELNLYAGTKMIGQEEGSGYEMVAAFYILLDILSVNYLEYARDRK